MLIRQGLIVNVSEKVNREKEKLTRLPYCGYSKKSLREEDYGMRYLTFNEFNHMSTGTCSEDEPCVCRNGSYVQMLIYPLPPLYYPLLHSPLMLLNNE